MKELGQMSHRPHPSKRQTGNQNAAAFQQCVEGVASPVGFLYKGGAGGEEPSHHPTPTLHPWGPPLR